MHRLSRTPAARRITPVFLSENDCDRKSLPIQQTGVWSRFVYDIITSFPENFEIRSPYFFFLFLFLSFSVEAAARSRLNRFFRYDDHWLDLSLVNNLINVEATATSGMSFIEEYYCSTFLRHFEMALLRQLSITICSDYSNEISDGAILFS